MSHIPEGDVAIPELSYFPKGNTNTIRNGIRDMSRMCSVLVCRCLLLFGVWVGHGSVRMCNSGTGTT
jgi:hypothetical protein